jgi:Prophage tail length tape measure protein
MALKTSLVITGDSASAAAALAQVEQGLDRATAAARRTAVANDEVAAKTVVSARQAAAGYTNLGRQIQDVTVQLQGGANIGTIIAQQGGQVADAVAQMGGRFAGFASFMAGPVGSVIIVVAGLLANQLIPALFGAGEEADKAKDKQRSLTEVLADSASSWEQVTEAARDYAAQQAKTNETTLRTIELEASAIANRLNSAIATRKETQALLENAVARLRIDQARSQGPGQQAETASLTAAVTASQVEGLTARLAENQANIDALVTAVGAVRVKAASAIATINADPTQKIKAGFEELRRQAKESGASIGELTARLTELNRQEAAALEAQRKSGRKGPDPAKAALREARQAQQRIDFGADAAKQIATIKDQFSDLPTQVSKSNAALRDLDKIYRTITERKPPNLEALLADIADARAAIERDINKPFSEYMEKARQSLEIDRLLAQGKDDQAEALSVILSLERQQPPLSKEQLGTVLATVQAERDRAIVLRDQRAIIQAQIGAVRDLRSALVDTVADAFKGRFSIERVLSSIGNSYINITAQKIVEATFGNTLRELEQQASTLDPVAKAGEQMAEQFKSGGEAVRSFADVVDEARSRIAGSGSSVAAPAAGAPAGPDEIVVTANRSPSVVGVGSLFTSAIFGLTRDLGIKLPDVLGLAMTRSLAKLEKNLPQVLAGAFTGASASRILLGDRGTAGTIGSSIGGVIGQKVGEKFLSKGLESIASGLGSAAGPIGSILGGVLGGLIGGIFATRPRGSATVTQSNVTASGNTDAVQSSLNTIGGQLQQSVQAIADRLGGVVGNYEVGFGQYKDYYQVSRTGSDPFLGGTYYKNKSPNALYDGKDAAAALAAAISDAITDGAIQGISSRVAAALKSSSDIDKAVREAVKVQDLELALGGIGEELRRQFAQFEQQAKERLRIAGKYGFDVVAVEKRNAEDRLKLQEKLVKQQVGSLQQLIDELTAGSLFEGSAVDQRKALLDQIAKARADANAGVEGAADTLNQLLQQLNSVSKDAYGTTGGFSNDRQLILDIARDTIAQANKRVVDAQAKASDPALTETNAQLNESNDQLAKIASSTGMSVDLLRQIMARGGGGLAGLAAAARI